MFSLSSLRNMISFRSSEQTESGTSTPATCSEIGSPVPHAPVDLAIEDAALLSPASSISGLTTDLSALHLQEVNIPGSFLHKSSTSSDLPQSSAGSLEALETIITAATFTAQPVDTSNHNRLFTPSTEFYKHSNATIPGSVQLDLNTALRGLAAVSQSKNLAVPSVSRGGRQFTRLSNSEAARPSEPHPTNHPHPRVEQHQEERILDDLERKFQAHYDSVFDDSFVTQLNDAQYAILDSASKWLKEGLVIVDSFEDKAKYRGYNRGRGTKSTPAVNQAETSLKGRRDRLRERMRLLHAKVSALFVPLTPIQPISVNADHLFNTRISEMDQINQVLIFLAVICNVVMGLSVLNCNFLIGVAVLVARLGMSTSDSAKRSDLPQGFSPSQNEIIAGMPRNLHDALSRLDVDSPFDLYATCPECGYTNEVLPLEGKKSYYDYPEACNNKIVGEHGISRCGARLLKSRRDGSVQPIKPYLVPSLPDYLARCLSDPVYVEQSKHATDKALDTIHTGARTDVHDVFEAQFIKDFHGPDGQLFVDRGNKIRLGFSIHVDFFNPNRVTQRGAHDSIGVISCANLALDSTIRYLPEYLYSTIIPGPREPNADELDHYIRPIVEQFQRGWRPGFNLSRTAGSTSNTVVEGAILLSINDLPAARKVAGLQGPMSSFLCSVCKIHGKDQMFCTDHAQWVPRDVDELRQRAWAYRNAKTLAERKALFETYGVRWSSLWLLEYWNPTRMLIIDTMHCILEGLVHYHCRHVLRLDASATRVNAEGLKYAFDFPWAPYNHESVPAHLRLEDKHIPGVAKVQQYLCIALAGKQALTVDAMWSRLDNNATLGALKFVAHSLDLLSISPSDVDPFLHHLYDDRAQKQRDKQREKQRDKNNRRGNHSEQDHVRVVLPTKPTQKNHFIVLLLDWRLRQPLSSDASIIRTGTPETLAHVQRVIRETVTPAWLNSVPKNYGEANAGSIKADEWRTLSTLYLPIALITLWGDDDGLAPADDDSESGLLFKALEHSMALFQATTIVCRYAMDSSRTNAYRKYIDYWVDNLRTLYPHTREGVPRPNIHAAGHVYDFLLLFGPVVSWWCFPFERLIGALQKVNTNDHIGGEMESTIVKTIVRTANLRRWLHRSDCPEAIRQLKVLFDKCFVPANAPSASDEVVERKSEQRAYVKHNGVNLSPFKTHSGNSNIIYRPSSSEPAVAGQIQLIENRNIRTPDGKIIKVRLHVQRYQPLSKELYDPFVRYPHFLAKSYMSTLKEAVDVIELDDVVSHAARFDYSHRRSVLVNMSRA